MKFKNLNSSSRLYNKLDALIPYIKPILYNNYEDWYQKNILSHLNKKTLAYFNTRIRKALISSQDLFICSDFDGIFSTGNSFYGHTGKSFKEVKPYDPEALKILIYVCWKLGKKIYLSFVTDDKKGKDISKSRINDLIANLSKFCKDLNLHDCVYVTYNTYNKNSYIELEKADTCSVFNSIEEYNSRSFIFDYSKVPSEYKNNNELDISLLPEIKRRVTLIKYLYSISGITNEDTTMVFFGDSISDISSSIILGSNIKNREFIFFYKNNIFEYNYHRKDVVCNNDFPYNISMLEISSLSDGIYKLIHLISKFV